MKWLKYKLFLILVSAIFGGVPAFFASSASGGDITTDPLVLQQTDRANWEPGGSYFPGNFWDRGNIIARGGNVTTSLTSSTNVGGWSLQNATISGQYTYTNDLTSYHPYTVHSPFNVANSASDSVSTSGDGRQVTVNMAWNGTMVHPANGYDGSQGGGYPAPVGAIDQFTFDITGSATGSFLISSQDRQQAENSNERFNPLTDLTVPTNIDTSPRVGGNPNSGSGVAGTDQTRQSGNDLTIQQNRNPTGYRQTEQQRLGTNEANNGITSPNSSVIKQVLASVSNSASVVSAAKASVGVYQDMRLGDLIQSAAKSGWSSDRVKTISDQIKKAGKAGDKLKFLSKALNAVKWSTIAADIGVSVAQGKRAEAFNKAVRVAVTETAALAGRTGGRAVGTWAGGALAGFFSWGIGTAPGALLGNFVLGAVGDISARFVAGKIYDKWAQEHVLSFGKRIFAEEATSNIRQNAYTPPPVIQ